MSIGAEDIPEPTPEVDMTVLGLKIPEPYDDAEWLGIPLEAFIVAKCFVDGEVKYRICSTEDLTKVESLGMLDYAKLIIESLIFAPADEDDDDEDDDE